MYRYGKMFRLVLLTALVTVAVGASLKQRPIVPMLDGRIVGGDETTIDKHPYQLSFIYLNSHICGASVLTPKAALTAGHCTDEISAVYCSIRGGSSIRDHGGQVVDVREIKQHPDYDPKLIDHDASVLILEENLIFGILIQPIPIHTLGEEQAEGEKAIVTGWGRVSESGASADILRVVEVPKVSSAACKQAYGSSAITDRMICYGYSTGGKDACQGDSGGPLVADGKLVGVVSWGFGCADPRYPGVYAKVSHKKIHDHIVEHS